MENSEHKLIRLLLNKEFYGDNKHRVLRDMFPGALASVFDTIQEGHIRYDRDMTVDELKVLHWVLNPTLTRAAKENIYNLLQDVQDDPTYGEDLGRDVLVSLWFKEVCRQVASESMDGMNGMHTTFTGIKAILEKHEENGLPVEDVEELDNELDAIFAYEQDRKSWKFNIPALHCHLPGGAGGDLMIVFARPETGKTAFHVSLACGPGGFLEQGAKVVVMSNEEPGSKLLLRGVSSYTGMTKEQIQENMDMARGQWNKIRKGYSMVAGQDMTIELLDAYCKRHTPDVLVVDQLDKIGVTGQFARQDQKLREIYRQAREIAKRHNCLVIAISQASAEAADKTHLTFSMMEESKTGKAAEADVIIGIGKRAADEHADPDADPDPVRYLTVSKNKINGYHGTIYCTLQQETSQYRD